MNIYIAWYGDGDYDDYREEILGVFEAAADAETIAEAQRRTLYAAWQAETLAAAALIASHPPLTDEEIAATELTEIGRYAEDAAVRGEARKQRKRLTSPRIDPQVLAAEYRAAAAVPFEQAEFGNGTGWGPSPMSGRTWVSIHVVTPKDGAA